MTDEEFQRLKEAEKEHLREKKRLREMLAALKERQRTQGLVQRMKDGAERLLRETDSLVDAIRAKVGRNEARMEVAAEDTDDLDLHEADEELRKERAESLVRQYKSASGGVSSQNRRGSGAPAEDRRDGSSASPQEGPDKTIGRMETSRSRDEDGS